MSALGDPIGQAMEVMTKAGDRIDQLRAWFDPLYEAALVRLSWGHSAGCDSTTDWPLKDGQCDCGHDALVAAVKSARGES